MLMCTMSAIIRVHSSSRNLNYGVESVMYALNDIHEQTSGKTRFNISFGFFSGKLHILSLLGFFLFVFIFPHYSDSLSNYIPFYNLCT